MLLNGLLRYHLFQQYKSLGFTRVTEDYDDLKDSENVVKVKIGLVDDCTVLYCHWLGLNEGKIEFVKTYVTMRLLATLSLFNSRKYQLKDNW